jgi:hypothetical protein
MQYVLFFTLLEVRRGPEHDGQEIKVIVEMWVRSWQAKAHHDTE